MKFSGKTINTVAMACFIKMINLHGTSLAPATAKFLKDEIVSGSVLLYNDMHELHSIHN